MQFFIAIGKSAGYKRRQTDQKIEETLERRRQDYRKKNKKKKWKEKKKEISICLYIYI